MHDGRQWNSTLPRRRKPMARGLWRKGEKQKPMERKSGIGRKTGLAAKKPMRKVSKAQAKRMAKYYVIRDAYLMEHPACGICLVRNLSAACATEIHHRFGRNGSLLMDVRGFVPSCRGCRDWPHEHPKEARALGVLGEPWEWGVAIDKH